ncbi:MAG: enolase C-terminal domain-like protein, partial [Pseudomonadota bacterium]
VLMIDSNEAWSAKETIHRLHVFKQEGFDVVWMEDPCLRDDFEALARVSREVPFAQVVTGEYLNLREKRKLIEAGAAEILNTHAMISHSLKAAWLAGEYGIPVTFGNTPMELGVHMAAALPEVRWMEYSFQNHNGLLEEPVRFKNGVAIAPDRTGLGLRIAAEAKRFQHDEISDDPPVDSTEQPSAPLDWR